MNKLVKELKPDDNLFEALFTITAAVVSEDSDLTGADEALHIVMQAITEKFFRDE